jgi:hypothetical protein
MEDWRKVELGYNTWLYKNKDRFHLSRVGQIESWVRLKSGEYIFCEIKTQAPYSPPPFWGHGLPKWQIDKYLQMQKDCNVFWDLIICDTESGIGYCQYISVLEQGRYFDTCGASPRRVYPLDSFNQWTGNWRKRLRIEFIE